jgi:hypothetical protein
MAIEYTEVRGVAAVARLPLGTLVAEVVSQHQEKRFHSVGPVDEGVAASMVYPSVAAVEQVADSEGRATGPVHLRLQAAVPDLVNVMSPMAYVCDESVRVVTASGVFGE